MTAKDCFKQKMARGRVPRKAGQRMFAIIRDAEARAKAGDASALRAAHEEAAKIAAAAMARKQAVAAGSIVAQTNVLRGKKVYPEKIGELRKSGNAPPWLGEDKSTLPAFARSLLVRDVNEVATWNNVDALSKDLNKDYWSRIAFGIERLRPKKFGLAPESAREFDFLRATFGETAEPDSRATAGSFQEVFEHARAEFNKEAGYEAIPKREGAYFPNPSFDQAKVQAWTPEAFAAEYRKLLDRGKMIDFQTGAALSDARFDEVLRDVYDTARLGGAEGEPSAAFVGEGPLSSRRSAHRTLIYKDAASWERANELFGAGAGPFDTALRHLSGLAHDTAMMRVLGPDPQSTKRFILSLFDREAAALAKQGDPEDAASMARAVKANTKIAAQVKVGRDSFETFWDHMTGEASIPVNAALAENVGNVRATLVSSQLGSAVLSSFSDVGTLAATARFNDIPATAVLSRAAKMFADGEAEITATQAGVVADTIAHGAGVADRYMGETIRTGLAAKMSTAVIRASGLRRWSSIGRAAFGMEIEAQLANYVKAGAGFDALPFKAMLERYGIDAAQWAEIVAVSREKGMWTARGEPFLRPRDLRQWGLAQAGDALGRILQTEMDFAVIEGDSVTRALLMGKTRPGTWTGEAWRSGLMYKTFPLTVSYMHVTRSLARGWDGKRLSHGAFAFALMTLFGMLSYQTKQIVAGRDAVTMDASTTEGRRAWVAAMLQGGGLGLFGDIAFQDKTRYGNSWASALAGPLASAVEDIGGQWALKNIQLALQDRETHFLGDALWIGARYVPGSSLWYAKLAYQRAIQDRLVLLFDDRAHERFARIEKRARDDFHQDYWWRRGEISPARIPGIAP